MIEIEKNKNGKCLVASVFILPNDDELIKRPFAYWHTRLKVRTGGDEWECKIGLLRRKVGRKKFVKISLGEQNGEGGRGE